MGDITTITALIVSTIEADSGITATVYTAAPGSLEHVLADENVSYPAIVVTYEGAEYSEHELLGSRISHADRLWRVYAIAKASSASSDPDEDAADILERVVGLLQGVTVDSGFGELWPQTDELAYSQRGTVAYAAEIIGTTRMAGL
jgi:hypothetical protein